jgi:hypothetical protein
MSRQEELRKVLEASKARRLSKPAEAPRPRQRHSLRRVRINKGFWILIIAFMWFLIDWFLWGPGTIGG